jgi:Acyclic terpene utilisation family protein AtuA
VADPCLYLAPMIHRYGWSADDWNRLASGIVAGHLLECTGQVVGGNSLALVDEIEPDALAHLGYPIAEVEESGEFVLTKVPDSPGCVSIETAKEQLLYEIHDPRAYITPDVIANFTTLKLTPDGSDRVRVTGVTGRPRTDTLKVNVGRFEGYSRELIFTIGWPRARRKAAQLEGMVREAWKGLPIERCEFTCLGVNSLYGDIGTLPDDPLELVVRVTATARDPQTLKQAVRRMMALGLSGPAGMSVSGQTVGAEARPILGLWPALISRDKVQAKVEMCEVEA